jgi:hypothetical protein
MPFTLGGFMTTTNFLVPPQELVQKWWDNVPGTFTSLVDETELATQAAQWGADQELEACCEWLAYEGHEHEHLALRAARRPEPPSLKEQALEALQFVDEKLDLPLHNHCNAIHTIRRALEALDD